MLSRVFKVSRFVVECRYKLKVLLREVGSWPKNPRGGIGDGDGDGDSNERLKGGKRWKRDIEYRVK